MKRQHQVIQRYTSEDSLRPGAGWFQYIGRVTEEHADITAEALYDESGHVRATRNRWQIRRTMEPDPELVTRVGLSIYDAPRAPNRGALAVVISMFVALLGIIFGALVGGVVGAIVGGAPGMLLGAAAGGWAGGSCALAITR